MANDILALGNDDPTPRAPKEAAVVAEQSKPRPVPELNGDLAMALSFDGTSITPDFFTSARGKPKKPRWKLTR